MLLPLNSVRNTMQNSPHSKENEVVTPIASEILMGIFQNLSLANLCRASCVSKQWRDVAKVTVLQKYEAPIISAINFLDNKHYITLHTNTICLTDNNVHMLAKKNFIDLIFIKRTL